MQERLSNSVVWFCTRTRKRSHSRTPTVLIRNQSHHRLHPRRGPHAGLSLGSAGRPRVLKGGIAELKIDIGRGFRVYYAQRGHVLIILLCGGDKSTQQTDIRRARRIAEDWNR